MRVLYCLEDRLFGSISVEEEQEKRQCGNESAVLLLACWWNAASLGDNFSVVHMHPILHKWISEMDKLDSSKTRLVLATAEKYICAKARAFAGTHKSTFSWDIVRIRLTTSRASCWDRNVV